MSITNSSIMRQKITLQQRVMTENAFGEMVESWGTVMFLNASVEPLTGREFFRANDLPQKVAEVDTRIRIRRRKGLDPAIHRLVHGDVIYDLVAAITPQDREQTHLMVKSRSVQQPDGSKVND